MCTISVSVFCLLCHIWLWLLNNQSQITAEKQWFQSFFCSAQVVHKTVCTTFAQLVLHRKTGHKNAHFFQKRLRLTKIAVSEQKRHLKNTIFIKYTFLGLTNCQLVKQVFWMVLGRQPPLKKPYFRVFFENRCQNKP